MIFKFIDTKNNLKTLLLEDESARSIINRELKEGIALYGPIYEEELKNYAQNLSSLDIARSCPEFSEDKLSKEDCIMLAPTLLYNFGLHMEKIIPDDKKLYKFYFEWDAQAIMAYNNRSNNPWNESTVKKYVSIARIKDLAKESKLLYVDDGGIKLAEGVEVLTFLGTKANFEVFFSKVAELLTDAEKIYSGKEYTNYKQNDLEEIKALEVNPELKEQKDYCEAILKDIEESKAIINDPNSSEMDKEDAEYELSISEEAIKEENENYSIMLRETLKNIKSGKYSSELIEKVEADIEERFKPHEYTAKEVEEYCNYDNTGFERASKEDVIEYSMNTLNSIRDSKQLWFNLADTYLTFNFDKSTLIHDNQTYDACEISDRLVKAYNDSKAIITIEKWIEENPKLVKNIIIGLKEIEKGDKKMKDSLKNVKFRFSDGTIIEVEDSDGKDFATVKNEAIKVYKQFKSTKDTDLVKEAEKETKEVLEEFDAKATNDSVEEETAYESAKKAFAEGKTLKEWFGEFGKDLVEGDNSISKKENAIEIWRSIKEEAEASNPEETKKELSEDEEWDIAYKNMDYQDSCSNCDACDADDVKIEDEVEEAEDAYEVVVNGKKIGTYKTLEEAEEAEKKALEAVEKGIPKPTTEDCNL